DADRQICRPPDQIHSRERDHDRDRRRAGDGHALRHLLYYKPLNVPTRYHIRGKRANDIAGSIERGIRDGGLGRGTRLPTVRALSTHLGVSAATVASAYRELRTRGLVVAAGRHGTTVAGHGPFAPRGRPAFASGVRDLSGGNPGPAMLPDLAPHLQRLRPGHVLYGTPSSDPRLLELAAQRFARDNIPPEFVTVVGG